MSQDNDNIVRVSTTRGSEVLECLTQLKEAQIGVARVNQWYGLNLDTQRKPGELPFLLGHEALRAIERCMESLLKRSVATGDLHKAYADHWRGLLGLRTAEQRIHDLAEAEVTAAWPPKEREPHYCYGKGCFQEAVLFLEGGRAYCAKHASIHFQHQEQMAIQDDCEQKLRAMDAWSLPVLRIEAENREKAEILNERLGAAVRAATPLEVELGL